MNNAQDLRTRLVIARQQETDALDLAIQWGMDSDPAMKPLVAKLRSSISELDAGINELDAAASNGNGITAALAAKLMGLLTAALQVIAWWLGP